MSEEYDYITLYLPVDSNSMENFRYLKILSQECHDWLKHHVGSGTFCIREWLLAHDTDRYDWCYLGITTGAESDGESRTFLIKDRHKAILFKLRWG